MHYLSVLIQKIISIKNLQLWMSMSLHHHVMNNRKQQIQFSMTKRGQKIKPDIFFKFFGDYIYMTFAILFWIFHIVTNLRLFAWFSLLFYAVNSKKQKNTVLGYKKWSKYYSEINKISATSTLYPWTQNKYELLIKNATWFLEKMSMFCCRFHNFFLGPIDSSERLCRKQWKATNWKKLMRRKERRKRIGGKNDACYNMVGSSLKFVCFRL